MKRYKVVILNPKGLAPHNQESWDKISFLREGYTIAELARIVYGHKPPKSRRTGSKMGNAVAFIEYVIHERNWLTAV